MFKRARGKMFDWLKRNERDNSDCGLGSPVQHLARNKMLGENFLAVHVNYLARKRRPAAWQNRKSTSSIARAAMIISGIAISARKPRQGQSQHLSRHGQPCDRQKSGKQKLELNMFEEMRASRAGQRQKISAGEILQMATVNGARALGLAGQVGELSENAFADLIAIPFDGKIADIYEAVLASSVNRFRRHD